MESPGTPEQKPAPAAQGQETPRADEALVNRKLRGERQFVVI